MNLLRDRNIARPLSASLFGFQRRKLCLWTISWMMSKSHVNRRNKRLISLFVVFRQVQNLRDELYQAKLRLEKETFSLKDTNKVTFLEQFSRWSKELRMIFIFLHLTLWLVKKNAPLSHSQPIRCKIRNNRDLVTRVFPRFRQVTCFESEFLLACCDNFLCSDWSLWFLWFWFYTTQSKCAWL